MRSIMIAVAVLLLLGWLCFCPPSVRAQTSGAAPTIQQNVDADEIEAVVEEEAVDDDAVNVPMLYTMTSGTFETGGRVLLSSMSNSAATSMLNQDQAEKSSLSVTPEEYALAQNYPNPFNPTTTISFTLIDPSTVTLKVYNALGQEVASVLSNELMDAGEQDVPFSASNLGSGVYFYRLVATPNEVDEDGNPITAQQQPFVSVKKMMLMK